MGDGKSWRNAGWVMARVRGTQGGRWRELEERRVCDGES